MNLLKKFKSLFKCRLRLLDLLFPLECLACQKEGSVLCENCFKQLKFNGAQRAAELKTLHLDRIFIAGDYDDQLLAQAIKKFKYNFISDLGQILARFLALFWQGQLNIPEHSFLQDALLVPLPLSKQRRRSRGFNQSEILANELAQYFHHKVDLNLKRTQHRPPQAELNAQERRANIRGVFKWAGGNLSGQNIVLIDDVITTGATLDEAARVLKEAGATRVYALVLAKG